MMERVGYDKDDLTYSYFDMTEVDYQDAEMDLESLPFFAGSVKDCGRRKSRAAACLFHFTRAGNCAKINLRCTALCRRGECTVVNEIRNKR